MNIKMPWEEAFEWSRVQANRAAAGMPRGPDLSVNGGPFTPDSGTPPPSGGTPPPRSTYYNPSPNTPQRPGKLKRVFGNPLSLRGGLGYAAAMDLLDAPHDIDNADRIATGEVEPETLAGKMSLYGARAAANAQLRAEDALDRPNLRETMSDVRRVTDKLENPFAVPLDRLGDTLKNYYTALGGGVALAKDFVGNLWEGPRNELPPIGTPGASSGGYRSRSPDTNAAAAAWDTDVATREKALAEARANKVAQAASALDVARQNRGLQTNTQGWAPEALARFDESKKLGLYDRSKDQQRAMQSMQDSMLQKALTAQRVAGIESEINAIRGARAANAGVPKELLDYTNGDLRRARHMASMYAGAQMTADARGAGLRQATAAMKAAGQKKEPAEEGPLGPKMQDWMKEMKDPALLGMMGMVRNAKNPQQALDAADLATRLTPLLPPGVMPHDVRGIRRDPGPWYNPKSWFYDRMLVDKTFGPPSKTPWLSDNEELPYIEAASRLENFYGPR